MANMICRAVRRRLWAYQDDELSITERIRVDGHLAECLSCARDAQVMRATSAALHEGAALPLDHETRERVCSGGLVALARISAERTVSESWSVARLADDVHLVWVTVAASAVALACAVGLTAMVQVARASRPDSLAAVMVALATPGSNANPVRLRYGFAVPRLSPDAALPVLQLPEPARAGTAEVAMAAVLTREGTVARLEVLRSSGLDQALWDDLVVSASAARFRPAEYGGAPVAVNMVWVVEEVTIRGSVPVKRS